jgi:hypothetical protein
VKVNCGAINYSLNHLSNACFGVNYACLEKVEATKKRLEIINQTANYLKTLSPEEIEPSTNMMVGRAFPKYSQKTLDVSWSTLTRIFERISAFEWDLFRQAMVSKGDIGSATKAVLEQTKAILRQGTLRQASP